MKFSEVADMSAAELTKKKKELMQELFEAKMKNALGQLTNPMVIRHVRRDIARMNTAFRNKTVAKPVKKTVAKKVKG
jgi:large subunit ribosomal protein L29